MRKAFTLIELLVVIAIIAILAAILFPVFAQAKAAAKFTALLSNTKQIGLGIITYTTDYDDTFPLAQVLRPNGGLMGTGVGFPFPYNDDPYPQATWATAARENMANSYWANAVYPYTKSIGLYSSSTSTGILLSASDGVPSWAATPGSDDLTYNGLLHHMSTTSVASPSIAVLAFPWISEYLTGRGSVDPVLNCGGTIDDCQFNPGAPPAATPSITSSVYSASVFFYDGGSMWQYGTHGMPYVRTDTSAKAAPTGSATQPSFVNSAGAFTDPMSEVLPNGSPYGWWQCTGPSTVLPAGSGNYANTYWCYFRPDRTK